MNRHPQGQLSRVDLLEALVAADNQAVEYLTRHLGLSLYVEPLLTNPTLEPENQTLPKPNKDDLPKSTNETHNQSASGIWKLDKREDTPQQAWPEIITQQEPINSPPLIAEPPKHYPLTSPRSLLARLFHRLKYQQDSCDIDVEAIVKKLSRGEHLTDLPKTHRRSLGKHLHLIDDRQLHLTPYWRDHTLFASLFEALLPDNASSRAMLQSGRSLPYSYTDSGFLTEWQLPPEGSVVLVFSDLGALATQAGNKIATWLHIARTLIKRHCKLIALVPCHPDECDVRLKTLFNIESWETPQHLTPCLPTQRQSQAEYLLTLLAPAIRLEPSMLRQLRITLAKHDVHIHAAVEAIVWQHPDMQEHSSVAATINSDARRQKWLPRFQAETSELQQTALGILRTWRTRLPPEIWYEEIVSLDKMASKLITEQDLVAAKNYFWQLIQPDESGYQLTADDDTLAWLRRLENRLPDAACQSSGFGTVMQEIIVQLHKGEEWTFNHTIDPSLLAPVKLPERSAGLYLINQQIVIAPLDSTDAELTEQNQLSIIRYKRPLLYIKTEENKGLSFMFQVDLQEGRFVCGLQDAETLKISSDLDSLYFKQIDTSESKGYERIFERTKKEKKFITWLHLSDLHLKKLNSSWELHRKIESIIEDLIHMENFHDLQPQLIFFTGDAVFGNYGSGVDSTISEQYEEVENFLTRVRKIFKQEIPKSNIFIIPGNHDIDRSLVTKEQIDWIEKQTDSKEITQLIKEGKKNWQQFIKGLEPYRKFLLDNEYHHLLDDQDPLIYGQVREIHGIKIGIGGFNSAWSCGRDYSMGKLWLGADWQNAAIVRNLKMQQASLKVALIHHPPGWYVEQEDYLIRYQMERDFDFLLHGHDHQNKCVSIKNDNHLQIGTSSNFYDFDQTNQENSYNFVRLDIESGDVEILLRKYDGHSGGWIPRIIANKTNAYGVLQLHNFLKLNQLMKEDFKFDALNTDFIDKVRERLKRIFSQNNPENIALCRELLLNNFNRLSPEEILIPNTYSFSPEDSIILWIKAVQSCINNSKENINIIKQFSTEIMSCLALLCVDENKFQQNKSMYEKNEIEISCKTQLGINIFVSRLLEKPEIIELSGHFFTKSYKTNFIDSLECGLNSIDLLREIEMSIYKDVFGVSLPLYDSDFLQDINYALRNRFRLSNKVYLMPLSRKSYINNLKVFKKLLIDLPDLKILIICDEYLDNDSIFIIDEIMLQALFDKFFAIFSYA